jgi:hypothetical protein
MTTLAVIRTHRWDEDTARLCAQLQPVFGDDVAVVFHNRPADIVPPIRVADIDMGWLLDNGLRVINDWGWRCGDYFHYRARSAFPGYDHYWLIEPDVYFTGPHQRFFKAAEAFSQDVLGVAIEPYKLDHRFTRGMPDIPLFRSIFALTRFSGRAIDALFAKRRDYAQSAVVQRYYANDEIFCFSHAMADPTLTCESLSKLLPRWVDPRTLTTDPDMLLELLNGHTAPGVFHPVRGRASFARAVAARIAQNTHFLVKIGPSLGCLSDAELEAIAADAAARCLEVLRKSRLDGLQAAAVAE